MVSQPASSFLGTACPQSSLTALEAELRKPLRFPGACPSIPSTLKGTTRYAGDLEQRWVLDQRRALDCLRHLNLANAVLVEALASRHPRLNAAVGLGEVQMARESLVPSAPTSNGAA